MTERAPAASESDHRSPCCASTSRSSGESIQLDVALLPGFTR